LLRINAQGWSRQAGQTTDYRLASVVAQAGTPWCGQVVCFKENTTDTGFAPPALKKLNGARFTLPSGAQVLTHAIGRGATQLISSAYASRGLISEGTKVRTDIAP
jgi:hypothetical protein